MGKQMTVTPESFQEKHARNLKNSKTDIRRGVEAVTESPGKGAARNIQKMQDNFNASIQSGKTKRALENIDLDDWKSKMINVGLSRIDAGIDAAKDKVIAFATKLIAYQKTIKAELDKMPNLTMADAEQRLLFWFHRMGNFKKE